MAKLKNLLEDVFQERPKVNKHEVIEGVKNYQKLGSSIYKSGGILETAKQLTQIAQAAHNHILGEQDDWFDKVSINKNMKQLKGSVSEFKKAAKESHVLNQRLTGLYEDIGHVLNRYYDINEGIDDVSDEEAADDFEDLEDKDLDNDGDTDDSDEYLHHKLGVVAKKTESKKPTKSLKDVKTNIAGIPALGQFVPIKK